MDGELYVEGDVGKCYTGSIKSEFERVVCSMKKTFPIICILVFLVGIILIVTSDTGIVTNYVSANIAGSIICIFAGIYLAIYFHAYFRKDK